MTTDFTTLFVNVDDCCRANASKFVTLLTYIAHPSLLCVVWLLCRVLRLFPALTNSGLFDADEKNFPPRSPCEYGSYLRQNGCSLKIVLYFKKFPVFVR